MEIARHIGHKNNKGYNEFVANENGMVETVQTKRDKIVDEKKKTIWKNERRKCQLYPIEVIQWIAYAVTV